MTTEVSTQDVAEWIWDGIRQQRCGTADMYRDLVATYRLFADPGTGQNRDLASNLRTIIERRRDDLLEARVCPQCAGEVEWHEWREAHGEWLGEHRCPQCGEV